MTQVTIQRDICTNLIIPLCATHNFVPLPPVPPVPPPLPATPLSPAALAIETITNAWWPPGSCLGLNKFTTKVFHQGMAITLDGHDCGVLIPHVQVSPGPNNMLTLAVHIPFSSRKNSFSASKVKMDGKPCAVNLLFTWPPVPMVYCADPMSPPLASAVTSHGNSVDITITLLDWIIGAVQVAANMVLQWFTRSKAATDLAGTIADKVLGQLLGADSLKGWVIKQGVSNIGNVMRVISGEGDVKFSVGSPYMQLEISVGRNDKGATYGYTSRLGPAEGAVNQDGAQVTVNDPFGSTSESRKWGESSTSTSTDISPTEGFRNETTTTDANGTTSVDSGGRGSYESSGGYL